MYENYQSIKNSKISEEFLVFRKAILMHALVKQKQDHKKR